MICTHLPTPLLSILYIKHEEFASQSLQVLKNMLTQGAERAICQPLDERKGAGAMVTYENLFTFVIMICAVITLVIYIIRKK